MRTEKLLRLLSPKNRCLQKDTQWGSYTTEYIERLAHHTIYRLKKQNYKSRWRKRKSLGKMYPGFG